MRLYDCALRKKVDVVIDDSIPCHRGSREPLYAQHKGNEMYILLLEKAFAKFAGGYANLVGGYSVTCSLPLISISRLRPISHAPLSAQSVLVMWTCASSAGWYCPAASARHSSDSLLCSQAALKPSRNVSPR